MFNSYILKMVLEFIIFVVIGWCTLSMYHDDLMKMTSFVSFSFAFSMVPFQTQKFDQLVLWFGLLHGKAWSESGLAVQSGTEKAPD